MEFTDDELEVMAEALILYSRRSKSEARSKTALELVDKLDFRDRPDVLASMREHEARRERLGQ